MEKQLKVVFMGTPEFAAESLRQIAISNHQILAVVTAPDKPAGRGQKLRQSEVKVEAERLNLPILQPEKLKNQEFLNELQRLAPDVIVVVAFRMLPKEVWSLPRMGTFNLHASLLPKYRGAAPINWAIINGESETGNTTFFINEEIDKGKILFQESVAIEKDETAGDLHDRLMVSGARLVVKTLNALAANSISPKDQPSSMPMGIVEAPKLFKENCRIDWTHKNTTIFNKIRGLCPHPTAWSTLKSSISGDETPVKIYEAQCTSSEISGVPGTIVTDGKSYLHVIAGDGVVSIHEIQLAGKKRMRVEEFLRGFKSAETYRFI